MGYLDNSGLATLWSRIKQLKLANPKTLTISGGASGSYDGSEDVSVSVPSKLANPNALTFTGGSTATYDGSAAKLVEIPTKLANPNSLTFTGASTGTYDGSSALTINIPSGGSGSVAWGNIGGTLSSQTDLQTALDTKGDATTLDNLETTVNNLATVATTGSYSDLEDAPTSLPNPKALTFTGGVTGSYDGSSAKSVAIPTKLANPNALSFTGGVTGSYDGSAAKLVEIPTKLANPNALTFTGAATGSYDGSSALTINVPSGGGSTIPIGTVNAYAGSTAPSGWLLCQGQSISRTTYADLFAVIGTTYGSNSSTTFCLPDLGGKMAIGVGGDGEVATEYSLGDEGGEERHLLTTAEMPSHTHTQNSHWHASYAGTNYRILSYNYTAAGSTGVTERAVAKASSGNYMAPVVNNANTDWVGHNQTSNTTATNQNTGGNGYHNNMPPYLALNYIIYAGV